MIIINKHYTANSNDVSIRLVPEISLTVDLGGHKIEFWKACEESEGAGNS